jgi:hypothetical protein
VPERTVHELMLAGLEAIRAAMPAALCAYVHAVAGEAPQLIMAAPEMSEIDPTEAFNLFAAFRDVLHDDHDGDDLAIGEYLACALTTRGARSRGLHIVGRRGARLDMAEREIFKRLARGLGEAAHVLETGRARQRLSLRAPIRVSVDLVEGRARAEVAIPLEDEIRTGFGESNLSGRAVVEAVIDAMDASIKQVDTSLGDVGQERAVLVLLDGSAGRRALGASLVDDETDLLHATATAAMDAAAKLAAREH